MFVRYMFFFAIHYVHKLSGAVDFTPKVVIFLVYFTKQYLQLYFHLQYFKLHF